MARISGKISGSIADAKTCWPSRSMAATLRPFHSRRPSSMSSRLSARPVASSMTICAARVISATPSSPSRSRWRTKASSEYPGMSVPS
jgi:hypothetical protein